MRLTASFLLPECGSPGLDGVRCGGRCIRAARGGCRSVPRLCAAQNRLSGRAVTLRAAGLWGEPEPHAPEWTLHSPAPLSCTAQAVLPSRFASPGLPEIRRHGGAGGPERSRFRGDADFLRSAHAAGDSCPRGALLSKWGTVCPALFPCTAPYCTDAALPDVISSDVLRSFC